MRSDPAKLAVELCGKLADLSGRAISVAVPPQGCSVADLLNRLVAEHPSLAPLIAAGKVRACVNETVVPASTLVRPSDVVALFPPVSGG